MLKMKKILSVALVVVMLFGVFALNTSALETGKVFGYILKSDKTEKEIVPGAIITVTLSYEMANFNQKMSDIKPYILYDKKTIFIFFRIFFIKWRRLFNVYVGSFEFQSYGILSKDDKRMFIFTEISLYNI